jgi:hypothetical protein
VKSNAKKETIIPRRASEEEEEEGNEHNMCKDESAKLNPNQTQTLEAH